MNLGLDLGAMRSRIELVRPVFADDGDGGRTETGTTPLSPGSAWASFEPIESRESIGAAAVTGGASTHRVRMHYHPGVTTSTRVLWAGRAFEVVSVVVMDEARRAMELLVVERA